MYKKEYKFNNNNNNNNEFIKEINTKFKRKILTK